MGSAGVLFDIRHPLFSHVASRLTYEFIITEVIIKINLDTFFSSKTGENMRVERALLTTGLV